jgi:hypothetical protein
MHFSSLFKTTPSTEELHHPATPQVLRYLLRMCAMAARPDNRRLPMPDIWVSNMAKFRVGTSFGVQCRAAACRHVLDRAVLNPDKLSGRGLLLMRHFMDRFNAKRLS